MRRPFNLAGIQWKDPRVVMRVILGILLAANLAGAMIAFKPFGGSADDLRRERASLAQKLNTLRAQVAKNKQLVEKVQRARTEGSEFLEKYITDRHIVTSTIQGELNDIAEGSGIVFQPTSWTPEPVDGSDTFWKMTINASCQGTYQSLAKFLNLVDKSPRFLIIESLSATPVQSGDKLNVSIKIDTFIRQQPGEEMMPAPGGGASAEGAGQ
jgi:type IV pilus assembly protein PilO